MAFNLGDRDWSDEVLAHIALDRSRLPEALPAGTVIGAIGREQAEELGLSHNVQVVVGGFDQMAAALGAGVVGPGGAVDSMGSADCITAALAASTDAPGLLAGGHPRHPHLVADRDTTLAYCFSAGSVLRWYRDAFAAQEVAMAARTGSDAYDLLTRQVPPDPSPVMLLPHFAGSGTPASDPASRGALLGLTLATTRGDIIKAILEGVSFEMRMNLESLEEAGVAVTEIRAVGGGALSATWLQLKADILNRRVSTVKVSEGGCLAMAMLAGAGTGEYGSLDEAVENLVEIGEDFWPLSAEPYARRYAIYRGLYDATQELSHQL
jgi:xylulokinase